MEDVPDLPDVSRFHDVFRGDAGETTPEGDMRSAVFAACDPAAGDDVALDGGACERRLAEGPEMVLATFVIPDPPGVPIMVPGQVIARATIDFMRRLDVKEIHGFDRSRGLRPIPVDATAAKNRA